MYPFTGPSLCSATMTHTTQTNASENIIVGKTLTASVVSNVQNVMKFISLDNRRLRAWLM